MLLSEAFPKLFDIVALRYELVMLLTFYEQEINSIKTQRSRSKRNLQSGAKVMTIIVTKQLLSPPFPNINVGHKFEGPWTSSDLFYKIDMGKEMGGGGGMDCLRIFCFWLSLFFVKLDLEKFSIFQTFNLVFDKAYSFYYIPIEYRLLL